MANHRITVVCSILLGLFLAEASAAPFFEKNTYVLVQKKTLMGVGQNSSGLTYCPSSKTLFIVDDEGAIFEITRDGEFVRKILLNGFFDVEGISYVGASTFALIEEGVGRLDLVTINSQTKVLNVRDAKTYDIELNFDNEGLEGLAYSAEEDVYFIAKQKKPKKIYKVKLSSPPPNFSIPFDAEWLPVKDISDMYLNPKISSHLFALSNKSKRIIEIDAKTGQRLSSFSLLSHIYFQKPEGLTFDEEERMYIVTEGTTDNFYCFEPKERVTLKGGAQ